MMRRVGWVVWLLVAAAIGLPGLTLGQKGRPAEDQQVEEGAKIFARSCSACHGDTGQGGRAPDLTSGEWRHGGSDEDLRRNILRGIPGTQMPAIGLTEEEVVRVIAWLRSRVAGGVKAKEEMAGGDIGRGKELFFGAGRCAECHMRSGRGGILGPDLTGIGSRRQAKQIGAAMAGPIRKVEVRRGSGEVSRGVIRGEETFTLRLMDDKGQWQVVRKGEVRLRRYEEAHPRLTAGEAEDLMAFLVRAPQEDDAPGEWRPAKGFDVTFARLRNAAAEPWNWLGYWGDLRGTHYSGLKQVVPGNAGRLISAWTAQLGGTTVETTPLVVDGMMFVTGPLNTVTALDAETGQTLWKYTHRLPADVARHCTVMTNRGLAVLGDRLFMATLDMRLIALDARSGNVIWNVEQDDYRRGISNTHAPLAIDGKVIVGVTAGECALTGFVDAFDAATGKKLWRTHTIPQPGDPNRRTWQPESAADYGGAPTWMTGTYDSETETIYWTTGNPGPDYDGTVRGGDNLYSCSVVALDAGSGRMKWWFQFTPHDVHDWDGNQTPMLVDAVFGGRPRKLLVTAQRNGFYYVLDRLTGEFLTGRAFAKQTWAKGLDERGRPIVLPNTEPTPQGNYVCPDAAGAANWGSPSYDPVAGLFLVSVREACGTYTRVTKSPVPGQGYTGGGVEVDSRGAPGAVRALDVLTGETRWNFPLQIGASSTGVLATAGGVVFASSNDGNLIALDSRSGRYLWHYYTGASIVASPMAYAVRGRQYVAIASQSAIMVFALPEEMNRRSGR